MISDLIVKVVFYVFVPIIKFICFVLIPQIIGIIFRGKENREYKNSSYYQITKLPYSSVKRNTGRYGEFLTYKYLNKFETRGAKFLFNVYIPKENGETTEIDVLMICNKGIFVFESKNYSGWIFGSEDQKNWYQTLPVGRRRSHKESFYNPILQNRSHIKHLKAFLGEEISMRSIIVFSERCTLKNVQIQSSDIGVVNRYNVASVVSGICNQIPNDLLSESEITNIYNKLYPYTQVDDVAREQHIANIHSNLNSQTIQPTLSTDVQATQIEPIEITATDELKNQNGIQSQIQKAETKTDILGSIVVEPKGLKCPKCNGDLVLRTATKGENAGGKFYGCSNYPKCKYIKNFGFDDF